jgi:uncharacterized DUF497 family protein
VRFSWDERKNRANVRKHGIRFDAAIRVFDDRFALVLQDREVDGEIRWQLLGKANEAVLLVAHVYEEDGNEERIRIISARKATSREAKEYHAQFYSGR